MYERIVGEELKKSSSDNAHTNKMSGGATNIEESGRWWKCEDRAREGDGEVVRENSGTTALEIRVGPSSKESTEEMGIRKGRRIDKGDEGNVGTHENRIEVLIHGYNDQRIVRYLKGTHDKGLIFEPSGELTLEAFADADFAGLWGVEEPQDATCVKSRTGYVIRLSGSQLVWKSKLQTLVAMSKMEAEYVALSACMRELIPLCCLLMELQGVFLYKSSVARMACTVFEDNQGAIALAKVPTITPCPKHIAILYHFFRENIQREEIDVLHVVTDDHLVKILAKGLVQVKFETLRKMPMGW